MQIVEQRSLKWFEIRKGKLTSSEIHKIMGEGKGKETLNDTAKTYLLEKVSELFGGTTPSATSQALEWGTQLESTAVEFYHNRTGILVNQASFISVGDHYGGSPDGLCPPDGIIEVKCPYASTNHFKHGMIKTDADFKKIAPNYYYQCISNMICANAKWCDFISFDPRVNDDYIMFIYRLNRNEEEVENMKRRIEIAVKYMGELKNTIENTNNSEEVPQDVNQ